MATKYKLLALKAWVICYEYDTLNPEANTVTLS